MHISKGIQVVNKVVNKVFEQTELQQLNAAKLEKAKQYLEIRNLVPVIQKIVKN